MQQSSQVIGVMGEKIARLYLILHGFKTIQTNYRCRCGEIDLIMYSESLLIFVEVKTRFNASLCMTLDCIDSLKQRRIVHTSSYFLYRNPRWRGYDQRFDVITVLVSRMSICWLCNAF